MVKHSIVGFCDNNVVSRFDGEEIGQVGDVDPERQDIGEGVEELGTVGTVAPVLVEISVPAGRYFPFTLVRPQPIFA